MATTVGRRLPVEAWRFAFEAMGVASGLSAVDRIAVQHARSSKGEYADIPKYSLFECQVSSGRIEKRPMPCMRWRLDLPGSHRVWSCLGEGVWYFITRYRRATTRPSAIPYPVCELTTSGLGSGPSRRLGCGIREPHLAGVAPGSLSTCLPENEYAGLRSLSGQLWHMESRLVFAQPRTRALVRPHRCLRLRAAPRPNADLVRRVASALAGIGHVRDANVLSDDSVFESGRRSQA